MLLRYEPVPIPLVVCEFDVVGLADVLQHTPLAVTVAPPADVTFPPLTALVDVIDVTAVVVTVGKRPGLEPRVKLIVDPAVPIAEIFNPPALPLLRKLDGFVVSLIEVLPTLLL